MAASPREDFTSAALTALWLTQVLRYIKKQSEILKNHYNGLTYLLSFCGSVRKVRLVRTVPDKITTSEIEAGIGSVTGHCLSLQPKICVDRHK